MSKGGLVNFELDTIVARSSLEKIKEFAKHPRRAIQAITFTADRLIRNTFGKQTDPWGTPWAELKESTLQGRKRKGRNSLAKLVDTKLLFRSLNRAVDSDNEGRIWIGREDRPVLPHLLGNPDNRAWGGPIAPIPARPMMPIRPDGHVEIPVKWATVMNDEINKNLPEEMK